MIPTDALPSPEERLHLFDTARRLFLWDGYDEIGIDHFARPTDSMAIAARTGHLRRNFQGYTDDTCDVLIGLGASAISQVPARLRPERQRHRPTRLACARARWPRAAAMSSRARISARADDRDADVRLRDRGPIVADYGVDRATIATLYRDAGRGVPGHGAHHR
jgi:oxygen-independent coproporphyrinogen-3 oxidase